MPDGDLEARAAAIMRAHVPCDEPYDDMCSEPGCQRIGSNWPCEQYAFAKAVSEQVDALQRRATIEAIDYALGLIARHGDMAARGIQTYRDGIAKGAPL